MRDFLHIVKSMSKRRIFLIVILSFVFTYITVLVLSGFTRDLFGSSVTLSALDIQLLNIMGHDKYDLVQNIMKFLHRCFLLVTFLLYIYLFYRHEKKRHFFHILNNIIHETSDIAGGHFHLKVTPSDQQLDELVQNINHIVQELKKAMEEERHIEQTKNELITNVSHDLRTPLTSIVGYLRLIEQDKYQDEVALRYYTGIAFEKAIQLEKLIDELFEYTRMQDHQLKLNMHPLNIAEILGQIIIQNELTIKENLMICRENISEVRSSVFGDGERLARVFENLLLNAVYYGKEGKYIDVIAQETSSQVVVTVTNYGNLIPSFDLPHIFDRFYRAEKSRATHTGGSGLGLAIAQNIITHHDGTIEVESNLEKTSFIVKLNKVE